MLSGLSCHKIGGVPCVHDKAAPLPHDTGQFLSIRGGPPVHFNHIIPLACPLVDYRMDGEGIGIGVWWKMLVAP